jgi:hypothetical protein
MKKSAQKILREEYNRLKKVIEKIISPKQVPSTPQLLLQPVRHKKY